MDQDKYIFTLEIAVRDYELDSEGIVNNAVYLNYLEHTRHAFIRQEGIPFSDMVSSGLMPVARRMTIDYRRPLRSGDVVLSRLWIDRKGPQIIFHQGLYDKSNGDLVAKAHVSIVCIEDGKISRGDELAARLSQYLDKP